MFQLTEFTEARLASVQNRTEKHGDEDVPAVTLSTVITAANTLLDTIDPGLRHALYKAVDGQEQLPGVEPSTPVLRANCIDTVVLTTMHEGWRLLVDDGIDDTDPMVFDGVKVDKLRVDAKQGGSIELTMRLGTSDIDADRLGKLGMHNGQSIWVKLLKPEVKADAIDGSVEAFNKDHPEFGDGRDATDLFAAGAGTEGPEGETQGPADETDDTEGLASLESALQADAREQAELEAGMAASIKDAGVKPARRGRRTAAVE